MVLHALSRLALPTRIGPFCRLLSTPISLLRNVPIVVFLSYCSLCSIASTLSLAAGAADPGLTYQAQAQLQELGFSTGPADGILGPRTEQALREFQESRELRQTGHLDPQTRVALTLTDCATQELQPVPCNPTWPTLIFNTQDFAPFHYKLPGFGGSVFGPIAHVVWRVCLEAEINCQIKLYDDWPKAQQDVRDGEAHGLFVIGWNSERAAYLFPSSPLVTSEYGLFVKKDESTLAAAEVDIETFTDYHEILVYGPSNTSHSLSRVRAELLKTHDIARTFNILVVPDARVAFLQLQRSSGSRVAVYSNKYVGKFLIGLLDLIDVEYAGGHKKLVYHVGFSQRSTPLDLIERFNSAYASLYTEEVIQEILSHSNLTPVKLEHDRSVELE